jgi:hypothetical protein
VPTSAGNELYGLPATLSLRRKDAQLAISTLGQKVAVGGQGVLEIPNFGYWFVMRNFRAAREPSERQAGVT